MPIIANAARPRGGFLQSKSHHRDCFAASLLLQMVCLHFLNSHEDMDWTQLDVHPRIISAVIKANIKSAKDLLIFSIGDLQQVTQLSITDIYDLQKAASAALQKHSALTALQLYTEKSRFPAQHQKLSLGCGVLNNLLRGGLPLVGITELAGESSAGKTQIALQLCLTVQYPETYGGLGAEVVSRALARGLSDCGSRGLDVHRDMLTECITKKLPILLLRGQVRLIIIDSIAALFRCEFAAKDAVVKAKHIQTIGAKLHQLSRDFTTPVFCINQ
ncbi:hypothetical protein AB205_0144530, partial [Aquarana catesbeiana]